LIRATAVKAGLAEPYLVGLNVLTPNSDARTIGFDANLAFQPQFTAVTGAWDNGLKVYDYRTAVRNMLAQHRDYPAHPTLIVSWDNTPRRRAEGIVLTNSTPDTFRDELEELVRSIGDQDYEHRLLFLNAWNEWAEGNYLEPDERYGFARLRAVRSALCPP
jgi:hypothetical protein